MSKLLIVFSVILMIVSAVKPNSFDFARSNVTDVFAPILAVVSLPLQELMNISKNLNDFAQLQAKNLRLTQENEKLREWYQTALLLDSENKSLRNLLNMNIPEAHEHISGRVIADSGNTYVKSLLVNMGRNNGVSKGNAVISGDGLVGRIVESSDVTARILLVTDRNSRVPVVVEDTGQHAIMAGVNQSLPHLIHLPEGSQIGQGARIITSGYGGVYPHGIPVGRVDILGDGVMSVVLFSDFNRLHVVRVLNVNQKKERER